MGEITNRRRLGAFYTPDDFAAALVSWAINGVDTTVLDPSYGGCSFLRTALAKLSQLGIEDPGARVFGTDIDPETSTAIQPLLKMGVPQDNLQKLDFLGISPGKQLPPCAAVVGNPPYVRHHWVTATDDEPMSLLRRDFGLSKRSSLWAYFVLHSIGFVTNGGRMAMVLPGAVLFADYAVAVRQALASSFHVVEYVKISSRVFADAQEDTVILLADRKHNQASTRSDTGEPGVVTVVEGLPELKKHLQDWDPSELDKSSFQDGAMSLGIAAHRLAELTASSEAALRVLPNHAKFQRLGDVAKIRIGVVTGANDFFVRAADDIPVCEGIKSLPIVRRRSWLTSGSLSAHDLAAWESDGKRAFLMVAARDLPIATSPNFSDLIATGESDALHTRSHCRNRDPWWAIGDTKPSDAFLPYMGSEAPSIVINDAGALCTNAIHRVYWNDPREAHIAASAFVSSYSAMFRLCAVLTGRRYGGGVLKVEPTAASRLPIAVSRTAIGAQKRLLKYLSDDDRTSAEQLANRYVEKTFELEPSAAQVLIADQEKLRRS